MDRGCTLLESAESPFVTMNLFTGEIIDLYARACGVAAPIERDDYNPGSASEDLAMTCDARGGRRTTVRGVCTYGVNT